MDRAEKRDLVETLHRTFLETKGVVVAHYIGLTVAEISDLRSRMRAAGAGFKVTKNTLARLAVAETGYAGLEPMFKGPTAVAYANDPVAVAKVAIAYAKTNPKLVLLGGGIGRQVLGPDGIQALASMPPIEELRGKVLGLLQTPASRFVGVLQIGRAHV